MTPDMPMPGGGGEAVPGFADVVQVVGVAIDALGVAVIVLGLLVAMLRAARGWRAEGVYRRLRQDLGRGILLGLELLVAADIIRTVAVSPTLASVLVLGVIVLIRTFLSFALEVELEGRWPWQHAQRSATDGPAPGDAMREGRSPR